MCELFIEGMVIMKERIPLKLNTVLRFINHAKGKMEFVVGDVIGQGGSCLVYSGYYINNANTKNSVIIKECYPYKLHITRGAQEELIVPEDEAEAFLEYKNRIRKSFDISHDLHESSGLTNLTSNIYDIYEANNTMYIVSSYAEGNTIADENVSSLKDAIQISLSVAKCIDKIHKEGFLYLDIKPENIFVFKETYEIIQLFDFDSVIPMGEGRDITEYRLSYSMGFAPVEQKKGIMSQIGVHTDVYSLGALVFYLIFGKAPRALDCGFEAEYDYNNLVWDKLYQNRVYKELTKFFNNTLQAYTKDRYDDMTAAIRQLEVILKYTDLPVPYICSTYVSNIGSVVGRAFECNQLSRWLNEEEQVVFVTGMGGIGKSTIVRKFISENRDSLDNVIYLQYRGTIHDTVADDIQFSINAYEREESESAKEYFIRKMKAAKELSYNTRTLLVIDNFAGELDEDFSELQKSGWKMLFVTRNDMSSSEYPHMEIERFKDMKELRMLFENNLGRKLSSDDTMKFERIVDKVLGHTLVLVLIAKQIARSYLTIEEASNLVESHGFSAMASEKVEYVQDGKSFNDKVTSIIKAIYDTSMLTDVKKKCLKIISIFGNHGIELKAAKERLALDNFDEINELKESGWIDVIDEIIQMHPLVQETISLLEWTDEYRAVAILEMQSLFKKIKLNGKQEDYPKKLYERNKKIRKNIEQAGITNDVVSKMLKKKGFIGEVTLERINGDYRSLNRNEFYNLLEVSKAVIGACEKDVELSNRNIFKDLLFVTLINLPKDQEEYIILNSKRLFRDEACKNPYAIIELYDYVVYVLCQKESFEIAREYINEARAFAKLWKDNYVWGFFYDMQNDFYEAVLDGAYFAGNEDEEQLLILLEDSIDKAMKHMKRSKREMAPNYYAKYALGKAALIIRSDPDKKGKKAKKIIEEVQPIIEKNALEYADVRSVYHMVRAWYYALCEPDINKVLISLNQAKDIDEHRKVSELDKVDYFYIPAANMICEFAEKDKAIHYLEEAYDICDAHKDSLPYIRKKLDLLSYQLDVYWWEEDIESCKKLLHRIDEINKESSEYGIVLEINEEFRNEILP